MRADEGDEEGKGRHGAVPGLWVLLREGLGEGVDDGVDISLLVMIKSVNSWQEGIGVCVCCGCDGGCGCIGGGGDLCWCGFRWWWRVS